MRERDFSRGFLREKQSQVAGPSRSVSAGACAPIARRLRGKNSAGGAGTHARTAVPDRMFIYKILSICQGLFSGPHASRDGCDWDEFARQAAQLAARQLADWPGQFAQAGDSGRQVNRLSRLQTPIAGYFNSLAAGQAGRGVSGP